MSLKALPKIVKAIFVVDKNRRYSLDVNQTITIHYLKKIIIAAANLGHNLRLFHEGQEYTDNESDSLLDLFPKLDVIIFDLELSYENIEELDDIIKLALFILLNILIFIVTLVKKVFAQNVLNLENIKNMKLKKNMIICSLLKI